MTARPAVNFPATLGEVMRDRVAADLTRIARELREGREELAFDNAMADYTERRRELVAQIDAKTEIRRAECAQFWAAQHPDTAARMRAGFDADAQQRKRAELAEFDIRNRPTFPVDTSPAHQRDVADAMARDELARAERNGGWTGD